MEKKLILLLAGASVCTYLGYSSLQAQREQSGETGPAVKESRFAPAPGKATPRPKNRVTSNTDAAKPQNRLRNDSATAEKPNAKPVEMKVVNALDANPQLSSKLKPLLPGRMTLTDAAAGFKKQDQFIAALHVSKNLGIPFIQIKARMNGEQHMSLVDAVRELRPEMEKKDAKAEVKKAEGQAKQDQNEAKAEAKLIASSK